MYNIPIPFFNPLSVYAPSLLFTFIQIRPLRAQHSLFLCSCLFFPLRLRCALFILCFNFVCVRGIFFSSLFWSLGVTMDFNFYEVRPLSYCRLGSVQVLCRRTFACIVVASCLELIRKVEINRMLPMPSEYETGFTFP